MDSQYFRERGIGRILLYLWVCISKYEIVGMGAQEATKNPTKVGNASTREKQKLMEIPEHLIFAKSHGRGAMYLE